MNNSSLKIDAAICDLISTICSFSDNDFDCCWFAVTDNELENLVVKLLQDLEKNLTGVVLLRYLQVIRNSS